MSSRHCSGLWDSHKHFYVVGSDTGARYRIRNGTAMNVEELDSSGKTIAQLCFAPQGQLVVGDVLLAQKIALETMERKAGHVARRETLAKVLRKRARRSP
jgi:hypothetical protein